MIGYIFPPLIMTSHWPLKETQSSRAARTTRQTGIENMASGGSRSSLCHCSARSAVHVHCFCTICNGKAVNYRTQISHLTSSVFETEITRDAEPIGGKL